MVAITNADSLTLEVSSQQAQAIAGALALGNYTPFAYNSLWHSQPRWRKFCGGWSGFGWHCPSPPKRPSDLDGLRVFHSVPVWQGLWLIDRGHTAAGEALLRRISPKPIAADAIAVAVRVTGGAI